MRHQRSRNRDVWPILPRAARPPEGWQGWPDGKRFALVLTHDVELQHGHDACLELAGLEENLGFRSSFNIVPERYTVDPNVRAELTRRGFEVALHGLYHDGKLYRSREVFRQRAEKINGYLRDWGAVGFRSPLMHHNLDWLHDLDIEYDASTFDTDPFEPQPDGAGTIFPFVVRQDGSGHSYVELPYTLAQDSTLFLYMQEASNDVWKKKLAWIAEHGGMALMLTHPDYMDFDSARRESSGYPVQFYTEFLEHIQTEYRDQYWHALPADVASLWRRQRATNHVVPNARPIWIDLDNSPHVPFFRPIIRELERRGHDVLVTARDAFQVCELAERMDVPHHRIGRHYGKHMIAKAAGLAIRSAQLAPLIRRRKPILAVSHGARSQVTLAGLMGIPSIWIGDYEFSRFVPGVRPTWLMTPSLIPKSNYAFPPEHILHYPGIKEDVYVPEFEPDETFPTQFGFDSKDIVVTIRPPATEAHYHNPESEVLFAAAVERLIKMPAVFIIILPRTARQADGIRSRWPDPVRRKRIILPEHALDGLNLLWWSDLVISGGGTMNREAAALGVPVYSIFRGHIGAVDQHLADSGRLVLLESVEDVENKLVVDQRERARSEGVGDSESLSAIVDQITAIIGRDAAPIAERKA